MIASCHLCREELGWRCHWFGLTLCSAVGRFAFNLRAFKALVRYHRAKSAGGNDD